MVTIAWRTRVKMSRMGRWHQTQQAMEFRALAEFAYHTLALREPIIRQQFTPSDTVNAVSGQYAVTEVQPKETHKRGFISLAETLSAGSIKRPPSRFVPAIANANGISGCRSVAADTHTRRPSWPRLDNVRRPGRRPCRQAATDHASELTLAH